jgi:hypothetical protein
VPVQQTTELSFLQTSNFVDQIYLYAGLAVDNKHETGFIAKEIRKHNYQTMVRLFTSLDDATFRAVLWDQSVHCLVWPPFVRYPGISETAKTDLRAYAAAGNNVVFLGNYVAVQFMNDVFGFQLTDDYQNGELVCSLLACLLMAMLVTAPLSFSRCHSLAYSHNLAPTSSPFIAPDIHTNQARTTGTTATCATHRISTCLRGLSRLRSRPMPSRRAPCPRAASPCWTRWCVYVYLCMCIYACVCAHVATVHVYMRGDMLTRLHLLQGATVAFVIRYDLGTVCYIGYNYNTPFHADQWTRKHYPPPPPRRHACNFSCGLSLRGHALASRETVAHINAFWVYAFRIYPGVLHCAIDM